MMKLFFDPDLLIEESDDGKVWIYSSGNHKWLKGNSAVKILVKTIAQNSGIVDFEKIKSEFIDHRPKLSDEEIKQAIDDMVKAEIFFYRKANLEESIQQFKREYQIQKSQPPKIAYLHPTHRCNFHCWYCYNAKITKDKSNELSTNDWIKSIEKLEQIGIKKFVITGGEPLLREDLYEILKRTKTTTISYELLTNGSLFNEENFWKLNSVIDRFVISLDSLDKEIQGRNRGIKYFNHILKNIEMFSKYFPEKLWIRSIITSDNINDIERTRRELRERYNISNYVATIFLPNSYEQIPSMPDIKKLIKIENEHINEETFLNYGPNYKLKCGGGTSIIAIDAKGDIYPCQNFIEETQFKISNVLNDNWYDELMDSPIRERFRKLSVNEKEICKECPYRYLCGGGCPAISWRVYKRLDAFLPFLCEYLRNDARRRLMHSSTVKVR